MNHYYPFVNTPLPYDYDALEPFIDEKTMFLHHNRHLQTYIDNLNSLMKENPPYQNWSLEKSCTAGPGFPLISGFPLRITAAAFTTIGSFFFE